MATRPCSRSRERLTRSTKIFVYPVDFCEPHPPAARLHSEVSLFRRFRWRALVAYCVLGPLATGCSFAFVQPASVDGRRSLQAQECTTSNLAPGLDMAITGWQAIRVVAAAAATDADYRGAQLSRGADMALGLVFGMLALSSAIYGFSTTAECRAARGMESPRAGTRQHKREREEEIAEEKAVRERAAEMAAKARAAAAPQGDGAPDAAGQARGADGGAPE